MSGTTGSPLQRRGRSMAGGMLSAGLAALAIAASAAPAAAVVGPTVGYSWAGSAPCLLGPGVLNTPGTVRISTEMDGPAYVSQGSPVSFTGADLSMALPAAWSNSWLGLGANVWAGVVYQLNVDGHGAVAASGSGFASGATEWNMAAVPAFSNLDVLELNEFIGSQSPRMPVRAGAGLPFGPVPLSEAQSVAIVTPTGTQTVTDTVGDPSWAPPITPPVVWDAPTGSASTFAMGPMTVTGVAGDSTQLSLDTARNGLVTFDDGASFTDTADPSVTQFGTSGESSGEATFDGMPATDVVVGPMGLECTPQKASVIASMPIVAGPSVTSQPASATTEAGSATSLTAAASGTPAPSVQWQSAPSGSSTFVNIAGATSGTLSLTNPQPADNGTQYRAVFTNTVTNPAANPAGPFVVGTATTNVATLTVLPSAPITVTAQPASATAATGGSASFTAAATGTPAPTVQWEISTDGGNTFADVPGATGDTLIYSNVAPTDNGDQFRAVFSNSSGTATSNAATLTVSNALQPAVTLLSSNSGAAGAMILISGRNFNNVQAVDFGSTPAQFLRASASQLIVLVPAGPSGTVDVTVQTNEGRSSTSPADQFTYIACPTAT